MEKLSLLNELFSMIAHRKRRYNYEITVLLAEYGKTRVLTAFCATEYGKLVSLEIIAVCIQNWVWSMSTTPYNDKTSLIKVSHSVQNSTWTYIY